MIRMLTSLAAVLLPFGVAAAPNGSSPEAPDLETNGSGKFPRCEIRVGYEDGSVVLEGLVFARPPVAGSYQMRISKRGGGGGGEIVQGGEFTVQSGSMASLGVVSLSAGSYVAKLKVEWKGVMADCTERVHSDTLTLKRSL